MPRIAVLGSLNMDLVVRAPRFLRPGETLIGRAFMTAPGGKGANQAVAARRMGADVSMIGRVGDDAFGRALVDALRADGVDSHHVVVDRATSSGVALITVDDDGENTIVVVPGANGRVGTEDAARAADVIGAADVLVLQLEVSLDAVLSAARQARAGGRTIVLNAAPAQSLPDEVLRLVDCLVVNEAEALAIAGAGAVSVDEAARALRARGARVVVVTRGRAGAVAVAPGETVAVDGHRVDAVDATAAGDAFVGALAASLADGRGLADAVRLANAAGALAVTRAGAQPSLPGRAAVEAWLDRSARG